MLTVNDMLQIGMMLVPIFPEVIKNIIILYSDLKIWQDFYKKMSERYSKHAIEVATVTLDGATIHDDWVYPTPIWILIIEIFKEEGLKTIPRLTLTFGPDIFEPSFLHHIGFVTIEQLWDFMSKQYLESLQEPIVRCLDVCKQNQTFDVMKALSIKMKSLFYD